MPNSLRAFAASVAVVCSVPSAFAQAPQPVPAGPAVQEAAPPAVVLTHRKRITVEADGRQSLTVNADVQINTAAGLETWSSLDLWFASDRQTVTLDSLEILKRSGERIRPANLALEDRRASGVFDAAAFQDLASRHVTVPSLAVGDRLIYQYRIADTRSEFEGGFAFTVQFPRDMHMREAIVDVDVPAASKATIWTRPGDPAPDLDTTADGRRRLRWRRVDLVPAKAEGESTSWESLLNESEPRPSADAIISSYPSWQVVGQWYRTLLDGVRHDRAPLAAKARELTAAAATEEDKLRALYRFVAREIRYVSLAFGIGRFQPRDPALVLETRYGDCKDKHLLLAGLAREIGITLDPVLIASSDPLVVEAPAPSQFDHLISVWRRSPDESAWLWLDSTSGLTGPGVLLPNLRDKQALLIDGRTAHAIVTTPDGLSREDVEAIATGALQADGTQTMTVTRTLTGDRALVYRMLGAEQWDADQSKAAVQELLDADGIKSSTVTSASVTTRGDPWGPLDLSYTATVKYSLTSTIAAGTLWVPTPGMVLPDPDKIGTPWRVPLGPASRMTVRMTYTLPEGWRAEPPVDVTLTQPFARYRSRYVIEGRVVRIERVMDLEDVTLGSDARPAYTLFRKSTTDDRAQKIGLRITAPPAAAPPATDVYDTAVKAAEAGQFDKARELLTTVTADRPDHPHAWLTLGRVYVRLSQLDLAQKAFERQIVINPLDGYAYNHLGMVLSTQRRPTEAEAAFRKQIEVSPLDKFAHRNLGLLLLDAGRHEEAVTSLETAASADRQDAFTRVQLGRGYLAIKAHDKAIEAFEVAAAATPPSPLLLNEAAWWLVESGVDLSRARGYAERGVAAASGTVGAMPLAEMRRLQFAPMASLVRIWDTLGWIAFKEGDLPVARTWLEAAYVFSDSSEVAWHVGRLREREGRRQAALEAYGRAASAVQAPKAEAVPAVKRLEQQGLSVPGGVAAADLRRRQTTVRVPPQSGLQQGEVIVSLAINGRVSEVETMSGAVPTALPAALEAMAIPGSEVAKARQVRLFRTGSVECQSAGACTIIWHRLP